MKKIFKYPIDPNTRGVKMPIGAEILHVHMQGDDICAWALVDPENPQVTRLLALCPTGGSVPDNAKYIGTIGPLSYTIVLHVYDFGEEQ